MADRQGKNGKPRKPGVLPDMEWLRKSRHDIPAIDKEAMPENPLQQLKQQAAARQADQTKQQAAADNGTDAKSW